VLISQGDVIAFISGRPITLVVLGIVALCYLGPLAQALWRLRARAIRSGGPAAE